MGFCRYCGDLVLKDRCTKCGGTPVAASFSWNPGQTKSESPDRWKQTYTMERPARQHSTANNTETRPTKETTPAPGPPTPARRFPRPLYSSAVNNRISEHISATTSDRTPANKHTKTASLAETLNSSPSGNPVLDDGVALSKVYGSVLQNPDTLKQYACASCNAIFTRDATLFPDPDEPTKMLCRHCFVESNGTKGFCAGCQKPVIRLKQEGQYVENGGKVWHEKCFLCDGCNKNIATKPSVDLFGRPCCPDCFDTSLQRPLGSKTPSPAKENNKSNHAGGVIDSSTNSNKDGSPVVNELSRRLGIQSKDNSPTRPPRPLTPTADIKDASNTARSSVDLTPPSPAIDDLTKCLRSSTVQGNSLSRPRYNSTGETPSSARGDHSHLPKLLNTDSMSHSSLTGQSLQTPELISDASDDTDIAWPSPPTPKVDHPSNDDDTDALCEKCKRPLFSVAGGGRIVTVPSESGHPGRYHSGCFVCAVCSNPFIEKDGAATYVASEKGLTHLHCAPLPKPTIVTRPRPVSVVPLPRPELPTPVSAKRPTSSLSNYGRPHSASLGNSSATGPTEYSTPNKNRCVGCQGMVAFMEPGVVPGPNGSRWHASCLVCGGKGRKRRDGEPGCGKKLDRDAKVDRDGGIWCSNCMALLILNGSASSAPIRTPVSATFTGSNAWLSSQGTGSSSVTSHSTGSSTSTITSSNTGTANGLSMLNRRSGTISPTKGMFGGAVPVNRTLSTRKPVRPRPKSVSVLPTIAGTGAGGRLNLSREMTDSTAGTSGHLGDSTIEK